MRILFITAGAANMYCGSCMRDNAMAAELRRAGHDVILLPLYTPTRTDETNVSEHRVFFSGISVYLEVKSSYFRKKHAGLDWLLDRPWLISALTKKSSSTDPRLLGQFTVSVLEGEHGPHLKEIEKLLAWLEHEPKPDIVNLPYSLLISLAEPLKRALGCPVCCELQGEELFLDGLPEPYRGRSLELIRKQADHVDRFLAVSEYEARFMAGYLGISSGKIAVTPIGINLEGHGPVEKAPGGVFRIGYMARVAPEKGLMQLCEAYKELRSRNLPPSRLDVAGHLRGEHEEYLEQCETKMREWGLAGEFQYHGEVDREQKIRFLQSLDVLSVPCTYDEPKGMFLIEAAANGVPFVQPRRGSFPEILEKIGAGILVEPDSPVSLADGIQQVWQDAGLAGRLRGAGPEAVRRHFSAEQMAKRTLEVFSGTLASLQANN